MKPTRIYGKNSVKEFLKTAPGPLKGRLLIARARLDPELLRLAREAGLELLFNQGQILARELVGVNHQGLLLELFMERSNSLGQKPKFAEEFSPESQATWDWENSLADEITRGGRPRVLILDRVQDPGNLGAIVRSGAQFGLSAIFIPKDAASGMTPQARKVASGGDCYLPVISVTNLARLIEKLKKIGFWLAAAVGSEGEDLRSFDFSAPFAVVLGAEGEGIRRLVLENCDYRIRIPMLPRLDSLNVSVAAGIILYEMFCQQ